MEHPEPGKHISQQQWDVIKMVGPSYRTKNYYDLVDVEDK